MGFGTLALICLVALLGPILSLPRWLHLPVVIGELLVGILLGQTGFGVVHADDPTFAFLAEVGFALVMFVAGTHLPLRDPALRAGLPRGLTRAVGVGLLAVPVAWLVAEFFGTGHAALYAVLLASSSAAIVLPVLNGTPLTGPAMVELLPQLAVADAACVVALPLAIDPAHVGRALVGALVVIAGAVVLWLVLRWFVRSGREERIRHLSHERSLALELRASLTILFTLAALAVAGHVSVMLAGFAAGMALSAVGEPRRVAKQLFAVTEGFFAPIFFVWLGASLDLRQLADHPSAIVLGIVLGLAAVAVHGAMVVTAQPWPAAVITAAQLGVPTAAAALGTTLGLLRVGEATALLLGALVTITATAIVAGRVEALAVATAPSPTGD
ncbi:Na+/H+ antiporter [Intrasporangium oryzae NRRL B-24470]|uniref:Na+/H+ antiporter n=1 Tax=Intrasporangium oryzae NRRL B-24470 TaxID=1386089 RepID=W9G6N4_9MICO|nr:cation:proton antiporter [Intrasporangium oryzae]EWT00967.1 Na+/H+ antiporter [Intrasporangium oryzae NRRL B-24470]